MQEYDFHIHGKPYSQDICKRDSYYDYLSGIYSNEYLNASTDESFMIIEILNGTVHYTYMRSKSIRDNTEREGSFFAITVSLKDQYCSVIALYNLLNQIYNKIAKNSFFTQSKIPGCLKYKVLQLEDANVTDQMRAAFENNVVYLNLKKINYTMDTIGSNETKVVSLRDVDSPEFVDSMMRYRMVVSTELDSAVKRCRTIESELKAIRSQKQALSSSNEQLQSEISLLIKENKALTNQLQTSASDTENRYKSKLDELQNELNDITKERDSLKRTIEDAASSIDLIDQPFQKLTRLLAGRFPESRSQKHNDYLEEQHEANTKPQKPIWRDWLNSILLGLILVCCVVVLVIVLKSSAIDSISESNSKPDETEVVTYTETTSEQDISQEDDHGGITGETEETEESVPSYDSWAECMLNIKGGGDNLEINKEYTLSVTKKGNPANIPDGYWSVYINKGEELNKDNSFKITDQSNRGKNVMIEYIVNGQPVKQRVCKIL